MPEGDTVWRSALHLDRALSGSLLVATDFRVPAHATLDLTGQRVESTVARGKHLLTRIGPGDGTGHTLHTHLRMEGAWHLYRPASRWRRPSHQARVVLRTQDWTAVGFALGVVEVVPRDAEPDLVAHLGPDLLGPDWDEEEALRRMLADQDRPVADVLLDQRNLAGLACKLVQSREGVRWATSYWISVALLGSATFTRPRSCSSPASRRSGRSRKSPTCGEWSAWRGG